jgi:glutathione S-transferase
MTTTLTYFDFDGSRGLECRLALAIAGVPFNDVRLTREQWQKRKASTPFAALPLLEQDGHALAQSNAILVYVGRTHDLHPSDPWKAAEHEALMLSVEDLRAKVPAGKHLSNEDRKAAREVFAAGWLRQWAQTVSARIVGPFIEGARMQVADLKLYVMLRAIAAGTYDDIPGTVLADLPAVGALVAAVDAHPAVRRYWQGRNP